MSARKIQGILLGIRKNQEDPATLAQLESGVSVGVGWGLGRLGVYAGEPSRHHGWERGLESVVNLDQVGCDRPPHLSPS